MTARAVSVPCGVVTRTPRARMVDQRHRATEADVERLRVSLDQRAIALRNAPVDVGVAIARVFGDDELIRLDAVDVGHHRAEQAVPAAAGLEEIRHRPRASFRGRLVDARIEAIPRGVIVRALACGKIRPMRRPVPRRRQRIDRKAERRRERAPFVLVGRMQPGRRRDRARCRRNDTSTRARRPGRAPPAPRRNAASVKRARGGHAGRARSDHHDVDIVHAQVSGAFCRATSWRAFRPSLSTVSAPCRCDDGAFHGFAL